MTNPRQVAVVALLAALAPLPATTRAATLKVIALQGDPSPTPNYFYRKFGDLAVSDAAGQRVVVFASVTKKKCFFKLDPDTTADATAVCKGDVSPDARLYTRFGVPSINDSGDIGFSARLTGAQSAVFRSDPTFVAHFGDPVPAPGPGLLGEPSFGRIVDSGDVVFRRPVSGGPVVLGTAVNQGLFRCSGGNGNCSAAHGGTGTLTKEVAVGDVVPDRAPRVFCEFEDVSASAFGIVFGAVTKLSCNNNSETPLPGVFRKPVAGPAVTIALAGEAANPFPAPGGTVYGSLLSPPTIANDGEVAFQAGVTGNLNEPVLFRCDPATCPSSPAEAAVTVGQLDGNGNVFRRFRAPAVSDAGDIGFTATVASPSGRAVDATYIRRAGGTLDLIAIRDAQVPGSNPMATFRSLYPPAMSSGGKLAFRAKLRRSTAPRSADAVLVLESPSGAFLDADAGL